MNWLGIQILIHSPRGQSMMLRRVLANTQPKSQVTDVTEWHINADEPVILGLQP